jgi:hypothetical protein
VLFLPGGIVSIPRLAAGWLKRRRAPAPAPVPEAPRPAPTSAATRP